MGICENKAKFRYTWAGRDESFVCAAHSIGLRAVADAIDYHLQLIPVLDGYANCAQEVSDVMCGTCDGCGFVANDEDKTPWKYWEDMKPPANIAVVAGLVKPQLCEDCNGACYV